MLNCFQRPVVINSGVIDLQLPNSFGSTSKFESSIEQLQNEAPDLDQKPSEPKPKWNPVGFQPVEAEEASTQALKLELKEEPIIKNEPQEEHNSQNESNENVQTETSKVTVTEEKVVTLDGMFKSSKKPVAFKKRKTDSAQQNLRQKTND